MPVKGPVPEAGEASGQPMIRPNVQDIWATMQPAEGQPAPEESCVSGDWWQSSAIARGTACQPPTPGVHGAKQSEWRERKLTDDDNGEWSYSMAP